MAPVRRKAAAKKPRARNVAKIRIDDTIARCPGGTPAYQHRKEFLLVRPLCTEAEVKMARGADYKPMPTFKDLPAGTKKLVRLTREEYCLIRDWRVQNGVTPFRKHTFKSKWGWNHEDGWDVYYMTHTDDDPSYR
ncbi:hypothetical protein BGAL_0023g00090 [Botrytis galanthina]|uniref:Uncharacterized protein n=1 Tax=Botrytis galanthina TaxID=278940 RepID=A0A4S8RA81_9HELO|nr:hypothetical protein BGAL_0023g00090 [Botrytis galanthina]